MGIDNNIISHYPHLNQLYELCIKCIEFAFSIRNCFEPMELKQTKDEKFTLSVCPGESYFFVNEDSSSPLCLDFPFYIRLILVEDEEVSYPILLGNLVNSKDDFVDYLYFFVEEIPDFLSMMKTFEYCKDRDLPDFQKLYKTPTSENFIPNFGFGPTNTVLESVFLLGKVFLKNIWYSRNKKFSFQITDLAKIQENYVQKLNPKSLEEAKVNIFREFYSLIQKVEPKPRDATLPSVFSLAKNPKESSSVNGVNLKKNFKKNQHQLLEWLVLERDLRKGDLSPSEKEKHKEKVGEIERVKKKRKFGETVKNLIEKEKSKRNLINYPLGLSRKELNQLLGEPKTNTTEKIAIRTTISTTKNIWENPHFGNEMKKVLILEKLGSAHYFYLK